ncbi:hypothetical protein [Sporosarcina sp. PTS2304]|uniref:hypothetical protein n=1 Tax=Sporosarcina sp. PTS2304 TaxID=2283194 RepID=UPI0013B41333|nr:hypothetical protein [Sporosarcina sp. PTS2304]
MANRVTFYTACRRSSLYLYEDQEAQYSLQKDYVAQNSLSPFIAKDTNSTSYSLLCAKLLGNGSINADVDGQPSIRFLYRYTQYDWAVACHRQLKSTLASIKFCIENVRDIQDHSTKRIVLKSNLCPLTNELRDLSYPTGQKELPLFFIEHYMNEQTLAWWYQECGHLKVKKNGTLEKLILSTEQWSEEELALLQYVLNSKFNLLFAIDGQKRLLLYDQLQINHFLSLVNPWIHPLFHYKRKNSTALKSIAKRTTLRLPNHIKLTKPTAEINKIIEQHAGNVEITDENFQRLNYARQEQNDSSRYQISLTEENQATLCRLQAQTGLTLGEIAQECFHQHNSIYPRPLHTLDDLSTTQQNIVLGSIMGDGMLTHIPTKQYGIRSTYHEHFSIKQQDYRAWKVMKMLPYFYFNSKGNTIDSRVNNLWSILENQFYRKEKNRGYRIKQLPSEQLINLTDIYSLATIYMDDGSLLLSNRINHNYKKIYVTPHIALYLQNFTYQELEMLKEHLKSLSSAEFATIKRPDGQGYYLRTNRTADSLKFLHDIEPAIITCPSMSYKTNWNYRFYLEKEKWHKKYPDYQLLVSDRKRMRPYTPNEVEKLLCMKRAGRTDQQIADVLNRSYWSVVYKIRELRQQKKL